MKKALGVLVTLALLAMPLSANGTNHAGPKTPSCGNYKVSTNEIIVGVKFPKGTYQINTFGISCTKVMGSKGLFAKFLKLKDRDPLPKPWRYLADAVGAPKFSSGPGVGFRVQLITSIPTPTPSPTPTPTPSPTPTVTPTPTPSPTPTPTPTVPPIIIPKTFGELYGNSEGIALAAWTSTNEKIKKSDAVAVRQDIFVGPNTTIPNANVKGIFENATRIFAGFAQPQSFYAVYYRFQDKDWAKAKFGELNISYLAGQIDGSCGSLQRCNGASAGKVSGTVGFSQYGVTEPGGQTDTYHLGGGLEIHEYTHIAQAMQFIGKQKDDQNFNYLPRWFIEGHAHIAGNTGAAKTIEEYTKYRADWLRTSPNAEIKSFEPVDIERFYASLMPGKYNNEMFGYVYTLGYITMECLVALKGIDSPTQLIVEVSNGLTFEEAFLKVYGISWNEASPILAKTVSQIFLAR